MASYRMTTEQFTQGYTALAMIILQNYALGFELLTSHNNPQGREPAQPTQETSSKAAQTSKANNTAPRIEAEELQAYNGMKQEAKPRKRKRVPIIDGDAATGNTQVSAEVVQPKRSTKRARRRQRHSTPSPDVVNKPNGIKVDIGDGKTSNIAVNS
ncbi:MAG: hypothetical protein M1839_003515 [Geoglossum umbratile]|nr:MAG: hypothetical protein M1839_003515 [Geoglossum umbratile]